MIFNLISQEEGKALCSFDLILLKGTNYRVSETVGGSF